MKHFAFLFALCLAALNIGQAEIKEIKTMKEAVPQFEGADLIVFDIDNTLMEPKQTLGGDQWFRHRHKVHTAELGDKQAALEKTLGEWMSVQCISEMQLVESDVEELINSLQNDNRTVIALTTRGVGMATQTIRQLSDLGVNMSKTAPMQEDFLFDNGHSCLFRKGILFTSNTHKGNALKTLMDRMNILPKKIVFINDKHTHLVPVEEMCEKEQIAFVGLRYGFLDDKVENFNPAITDLQFDLYRQILSDEDAQRILADREI